MKSATRIAPRPFPVLCSSHLTGDGIRPSDDGKGWIFAMVAAVYGVVNDRIFEFLPRSGAKTIAERVPAGLVALHDGHPPFKGTSTNLGFLLSAEETETDLRFVAFLSGAEENVAKKIDDRTIKQTSIEMFPIQTVKLTRPLSAIPEHVREFVSLDRDGNANVTGVVEYRLEAVGLVSSSSQGIDARLDLPGMMPFQGFPVSQTGSWNAVEASNAVGKCPSHCQPAAYLAAFRGRDGKEVLAGLYAKPDESGQLVCFSSALDGALADVNAKLAEAGITGRDAMMAAAYETASRYRATPERLTAAAADGTKDPDGTEDSEPEKPAGTVEAAEPDLDPAPEADSQEPAGPTSSPTAGSEEAAVQLRAAELALMKRQVDIDRQLHTVRKTNVERDPRQGLPP